MGLEIVDIVLSAEERFGISIPDRDALRMSTVGDMHRYVLGRLSESGRLLHGSAREGSACPNVRAFNHVRRALTGTVRVSRRAVRPDARLSSMLPWPTRRSQWARLESELGQQIPELVIPRWMGLIPSTVGACAFLCMGKYPIAAALLFAGCLTLCAPLLLKIWPLRLAVPRQCATVGDMTLCVKLSESRDTQTGADRFSPGDAWRVLHSIIVEVLDIPPTEVTPEARLVQDLGAG